MRHCEKPIIVFLRSLIMKMFSSYLFSNSSPMMLQAPLQNKNGPGQISGQWHGWLFMFSLVFLLCSWHFELAHYKLNENVLMKYSDTLTTVILKHAKSITPGWLLFVSLKQYYGDSDKVHRGSISVKQWEHRRKIDRKRRELAKGIKITSVICA